MILLAGNARTAPHACVPVWRQFQTILNGFAAVGQWTDVPPAAMAPTGTLKARVAHGENPSEKISQKSSLPFIKRLVCIFDSTPYFLAAP